MPLTADPEKNIRELYHSADKKKKGRMAKLARKYGRNSEHFRKIVVAAAYEAARRRGYKG